MKTFLWPTFLDYLSFKAWIQTDVDWGKGRGAETRDKLSRKNSTNSGQFPDSASRNMYSIFKLFYRAKEYNQSDFGIGRL